MKINNKRSAISQDTMQKTYQLVMQSPSIMALFKGPQNVIELANEAVYKLWGKSAAIIGKPVLEAIPELTGQGIVERLDYVRNTGKVYSANSVPVKALKSGANLRYFDLLFQPYYDPGCVQPTGVLTLSHDVTEIVLAKQKAERNEIRLQQTFSIDTVGVIYFDLDGRIHDANKAFEKMSGFSREDFVSGKVRWDQLTPPEFMAATLKSREEFLTRWANTPYEKQYFKPDGSRWWGLFAGKRIGENECVEFVLDITLMKQVEVELEKRVRERTEELQRLNMELNRSNLNLEQFAYAASHDLKEPIRKIQLYATRLKDGLKSRASESEHYLFHQIEQSVSRMNNLIEDLLAYSHLGTQYRSQEDVDVNDLVRQVLIDLDFEIEARNAKISVEELCVIQGDKRQLQQIFQNLIGNSLKYSKAGIRPEIIIKCSKVKGSEIPDNKLPATFKNGFHLITIKDNGIGFEQKDAERIFDVFTRLHGKNEFRGTGIGLSIVKRIMDNHGGMINAQSQPGAGALFRLYFPIQANNNQQKK